MILIAQSQNFNWTPSTPPPPGRSLRYASGTHWVFLSFLGNPYPRATSALIILLSPLFTPCLYFLDLKEPLILYSDSAHLHHAKSFLEPEQRGHLQSFVKIVEPCSPNYRQTYNKWRDQAPYLLSPFFFPVVSPIAITTKICYQVVSECIFKLEKSRNF